MKWSTNKICMNFYDRIYLEFRSLIYWASKCTFDVCLVKSWDCVLYNMYAPLAAPWGSAPACKLLTNQHFTV